MSAKVPTQTTAGSAQNETQHVFISYSRQDQLFVRRLHAELEHQAIPVWIDWEDIPPAAAWIQEIRSAIESAHAFIFVISPASVASPVCQEELVHALEYRKRIVPVLWLDTASANVPRPLVDLNWIFLRDSDDFASGTATLLEALRRDPDWVRMHTYLLQQAMEWESKERDPALLLRGRSLKAAEEWQGEANPDRDPAPLPLHYQYILASRRGHSRRQQMTLAGVSGALVVTVILAALALLQRNQAIHERQVAVREQHRALSRSLATQSSAHLNDQPDLALLLALEATRESDTVEAKSSLYEGLRHAAHLDTYLHGQNGYVNSLAVSPDGQLLFSGYEDGTVRLWNVASRSAIGPPVGALPGKHQERVRQAEFSPTGQLIASSLGDGSVVLWDVRRTSSRPARLVHVRTLNNHGGISPLAFSPDGHFLALENGLWDTRKQAGAGVQFPPQAFGTRAQAFSPDGHLLARGGADGATQLWSVQGRPHLLLTVPTQANLSSLSFSPVGHFLVSGSLAEVVGGGGVQLWSLARNRVVARLFAGISVRDITFSTDGALLAAACGDGTVRLWDVRRRRPVLNLSLSVPVGVNSVVFLSGQSRLASGSDDGLVRLWRISPRSFSRPLVPNNRFGQISALRLSPNGAVLAIASDEGTFRFWNTRTRVLSGDLFMAHASVLSLGFSPDGAALATGGSDGSVQLWDTRSRKPLKRIPRWPDFTNGTATAKTSVAFSPDGAMLASGNADGSLELWNVTRGQLIQNILPAASSGAGEPPHGVGDVVFSPNGSSLAASTELEAPVFIWNVEHNAHLGSPHNVWDLGKKPSAGEPFSGSTNSVNGLAFSPDNRWLAVGATDGTIRLWNVLASPRHEARLTVYGGIANPNVTEAAPSQVRALAFSPDSNLLVSETGAGIRLWDVAGKRPLGGALQGYGTAHVTGLTYTADGKSVISGHEDGTLQVWDVNAHSWQHLACTIANRNLTQDEWALYVGTEPYQKTCS